MTRNSGSTPGSGYTDGPTAAGRFAPRMVVNNLDKSRAEDFADCLCRIARERSTEAFATLYQYFAPRIKAYFIRLGADAGSAEELTQDTMLLVWRRAETYQANKAAASTWMFTIARNRYIDAKCRRIGPTELLPVDDLWPVLEDDSMPTDEQADLLLRGRELRLAMSTLPAAQSEVIEKAYFEDKSHQEIADELGVPVGTVKSRIRLALQRMHASFLQG
jgi:RNA polymerase sigma-70 factor (ECF subfamily)